jgi:hypothetical protein
MKNRIPPASGRRSTPRAKRMETLPGPAQVLIDRVNEVMADPANANQPRYEFIVQSGPDLEKQPTADGVRLRVTASRIRFKIER